MSDGASPRPLPFRSSPAGLVLLALGACAPSGDAPAGSAETEPRHGGTAVVTGQADLVPLNPLTASEEVTSQILRHGLFLTLVGLDEELAHRPRLAESWTLEGDTAVVFRLRRDVAWHDGAPTTAHDVAFTFDRLKDPETAFPYAARFQRWNSARAVDSFTVRATLTPHIDALTAWATTPIVPAHLLEDTPAAELGRALFGRSPVGNGPFRFVEWRAGERLVLEANPDFPEGLGGRPWLDRLVYRVIPDLTAALAALQSGQVDLVLNVPVGEVPRVAERMRVIQGPVQQFAFIAWNGRRAPLGDARVRRALTMAIDRATMVQLLRSGYGAPAVGPVPPDHWAFAGQLEPLPFDTVAARALLDEVGYADRDGDGVREGPDGRPLRLELKYPSNDAVFRSASELVRSDLARIGVAVEARPTEGTTLIGEAVSPERPFDAVLLSWNVEEMPEVRGLFHSAELEGDLQLAGYRSARADSLMDALAAADTREAALPIWAELQGVLREEQPWSFLYYFAVLAGVSERLEGVDMDLRGQLVSMPSWWIAGADAR